MSLLCGVCINYIPDSNYGILYLLKDRGKDGLLRKPKDDLENEYVPPNSAICGQCFATLPDTEKVLEAEALKEDLIFGFAWDNGPEIGPGGAKWSSVMTDCKNLTYIRRGAVDKHFNHALLIIEDMLEGQRQREKAKNLREQGKNCCFCKKNPDNRLSVSDICLVEERLAHYDCYLKARKK